MADSTVPGDANQSDQPVHERHRAMRRWMLPVLGVLLILNLAAFVHQLPLQLSGQPVETVGHPTICTDDSPTVDHIVHVLPHSRDSNERRATVTLFRPCESSERHIRIHVNGKSSHTNAPAVGDAVVNSNVIIRRVQ